MEGCGEEPHPTGCSELPDLQEAVLLDGRRPTGARSVVRELELQVTACPRSRHVSAHSDLSRIARVSVRIQRRAAGGHNPEVGDRGVTVYLEARDPADR